MELVNKLIDSIIPEDVYNKYVWMDLEEAAKPVGSSSQLIKQYAGLSKG